MPAGLARLVDDARVDWRYYTEPEPELNGRRLYWPRGRVLGGSSSINAMCYTRGHRLDYDEWAALGADGWDYASVLPYFRKAEDQARGSSEHHGVGGPLSVEDLRISQPLECHVRRSRRAVRSAPQPRFQRRRAGRRRLLPSHAAQGPALQHGRRLSAAGSAARQPRGPDPLPVHARAVRRPVRRGGRIPRPAAHSSAHGQSGEVILAAGAIGSPQLLMLSGVGPAGRAARARHRDAGRQPGSGAQFAGSSRFLHLEQVHGKDQLRFQRLPGAHRRGALPADAFGPRSQQHCRSGRFPAQPSGARRASRHSIPLRARAARRSRAQSLKRARLHAARLRAAPVEPRIPLAQIRAAAGSAAHLRFLSERSEGP